MLFRSGYRSLGPTRARVYGGADYGEHANSEILTFAMVETKESVENIEEIVSVNGLDAIFIGSGDLKLAYTGKATHVGQSEEFDKAVETVLESCKKHNVVPGIWCATIEDAQLRKAQGFRFIAPFLTARLRLWRTKYRVQRCVFYNFLKPFQLLYQILRIARRALLCPCKPILNHPNQ